MIKLSFPVEGPDNVVDICFGEIRDEYLSAQASTSAAIDNHKDALRGRISAYVDARGNPKQVGDSPFPRTAPPAAGTMPTPKPPPTVGDLLFARYNSGGGTQKEKEIVAHATRVGTPYCPYCGL
jgi:hypothetical protein